MNEMKMRDALKRAYASKKWALKVNKMSDTQVVAVYMRLKQQSKV